MADVFRMTGNVTLTMIAEMEAMRKKNGDVVSLLFLEKQIR